MKYFNTRLYASVLGLLFLLIAGLSPSAAGQDQTTEENALPNQIIIKKKIITENGETKVLEHIEKVEGNYFEIKDDQHIILMDTENGEDAVIKIITDGDNSTTIIQQDCMPRGQAWVAPESPHSFTRARVGRALGHDPEISQLDVVRMKEGEQLPDHIVEVILEMGLDPAVVQQQFDQAENMVYISKVGEATAEIVVDGPEPASLGGLNPPAERFFFAPDAPHQFEWHSKSDENFNFDYDFDFDFDFDFDVEEGEERKFRFQFKDEIPDEFIEQMKEHNIEIDVLDNNEIKIIAPEGNNNFNFNINENDGVKSIEIEIDGLLENLKSLENIELNTPKEEHFQHLFDLNNNSWMSSCDDNKAEPKPMLGVYLGETTESGVSIDKVIEGSAAEEAGLQEGDVITAINNATVTSYDALVDAISEHKVGDQITVSYSREGAALSVVATLKGKKEKPAEIRKFFHHDDNDHHHGNVLKRYNHNYFWKKDIDCQTLCNAPFLGVWIENLDEEGNGVHVTGIFDNTGAEKANLQEGDVILSIEGTVVNDIEEVIEEVGQYQPGDQVEVVYSRDGARTTVTATLSSKAASKDPNPCDCETGELIDKPAQKQELIIIKDKDEVTEEVVPEEETTLPEPPVNQSPAIERTLQLRSFSLFPNPNAGDFSINFRAENPGPILITVVDINGREVYRENVDDFRGSYYQDINISQFGAGVYFLSIIQGDKIWTERFIFSND